MARVWSHCQLVDDTEGQLHPAYNFFGNRILAFAIEGDACKYDYVYVGMCLCVCLCAFVCVHKGRCFFRPHLTPILSSNQPQNTARIS